MLNISTQLNSIDNMRVDGKFMVGQDIPEGQGSVTSLLADCFDMLYDLKVDADEEKSNGGEAHEDKASEGKPNGDKAGDEKAGGEKAEEGKKINGEA